MGNEHDILLTLLDLVHMFGHRIATKYNEAWKKEGRLAPNPEETNFVVVSDVDHDTADDHGDA